MVVMRLGVASLMVRLDYTIEWIYAALIGDYIVKSIMLVRRYRGGRWKTALEPEPSEVVRPIEPAET